MAVINTPGTTGDDTISITRAGIYSSDMGNGNDSFYADYPSNFTLLGGNGNDTVHAEDVGIASIFLGAGDDSAELSGNTWIVDGGAGNDTFVVSGAAYKGGPFSQSLSNLEDNGIVGGDGNDSVILHGGHVIVTGGNGDDTITGSLGNLALVYGNIGNDSIAFSYGSQVTAYGGQGNDTFYAEEGQDLVFGNLGNDSISESYSAVTVYGGQGDDSIYLYESFGVAYGNLGNDSIYQQSGVFAQYGGQGADSIYVSDGTALVYGNLGNDTVYLYTAAATVYGGQGTDSIMTYENTLALIKGGLGADTVTLLSDDSSSGVNKDIGNVEIIDFSTEDVLDLHDTNASLTTIANWDAHSQFLTTGGTNLLVQFTSSGSNTETLTFDGLGGKGFSSFASMNTAGYHIIPT